MSILKRQSASDPSGSSISTGAGTVFTLTKGQLGFIQNLGTDPLAVKLGEGAAANSLNLVLAPGEADDDGKGASIYIDDYLGAVSVAAVSGDVRCIAWSRQVG